MALLRYVEILIGLGAVMLIGATVVASVTQWIGNMSQLRARSMAQGLTSMLGELGWKEGASALANELLCHPMVAEAPTWSRNVIRLFARVRSLVGQRSARDARPLAAGEPAEVVQLHEFAMLLLDRAQTDETVRTKLRSLGVADAAGTLRRIRSRALAYQAASPAAPAHQWYSQAIIDEAPAEFSGKIFAWFDNTSERAREFFSLRAKMTSSVVALLVAFTIQLDSIGLIRRLTKDDELRKTLVAEAEVQTKRYEEAQAKRAEASTNQQSKTEPDAERIAAEAKTARERIVADLATLRDDRVNAIPGYLALARIQQLDVPSCVEPRSDSDGKTKFVGLKVDGREYRFIVPDGVTPDGAWLTNAIRQSGAPVVIYPKGSRLRMVAARDDIASIVFESGSPTVGSWPERDWDGLTSRLPGVALSWIFLSLGAPFWYDLVKKALGFRSLLANRDEKDRADRIATQPSETIQPLKLPATAATTTGPPEISAVPALIIPRETAIVRREPRRDAQEAGTLTGGLAVMARRTVRGEIVDGNDAWYELDDGEYVWAGTCSVPEIADQPAISE